MHNERVARFLVLAGGALYAAVVVLYYSWWHTTTQLSISAAQGIFPTAEEGMRQLVSRGYVGIEDMEIAYAGPNSFTGASPHVWYVIAEVRAASRVGPASNTSGVCDGPGSFFLNTEDGWVHVPEGAFPEMIGFWMRVYGLAGPGQSEPSITWPSSPSLRLCQSA
jgi:hypothetical protein